MLTACNTVDGQGKYRVATIGNALRSISANVLTTEPVFIQQATSRVGSIAGGLMGSTVFAQNMDNVAIILSGIIGEAIVGDMIESSACTLKGMEYVIQTATDLLLTVAKVNKGNSVFTADDRVIMVYG